MRDRRWIRLLWAGAACAGALGVAVLASESLRSWLAEVPGRLGALPALYTWVLVATMAAVALLALRTWRISGGMDESKGHAGALYQNLFDASPLPMWVMEEGSWRIVEVNRAAVAKYGYRHDEFLGMTAIDIQVPEDRERVVRQLRGRDPVAVAHIRRRHLTKAGDIIIAEVTAQPCVFRGRAARLILVDDVTARVRAEESLRESEARYRDLFERSPSPAWVYDVETLRFLMVNDAALQIYKYSRDEFLGLTVMELNAPEERAGVLARTEKRSSMEYSRRHARHVARDGTVIEMDVFSGPIRFGGRRARQVMAYDITERRKIEDAIGRERALLRAVIDNLPDNIYVKDRESRYVLMNPAGLAHRGVRREAEVLGKATSAFYPDALAKRFDEEDREVMATGRPLVDRERSEVAPGGAVRHFLGTKVPLRDSEGETIGVVGIGRDITELRQGAETIRKLNTELEQRVRERTAQLEAANRELEAFSFSVSHDLKAPLRSIEGFARALREDYGRALEGAAGEFLERICAASQRMGELIDDLLALSRVTRAEMVRAPVNLSEMAEDIVADLRRAAPERASQVAIAPNLVVQGDPNLLRVALENLLANAWKFSGGKAQTAIEVGSVERGGETAYFVRDHGAGFDMTYAGRLFTAFQRLHGAKEFPGTGVGLATVQRVIFRHGGRVWADGAVGRGATFYFTVP